MGKSKSEETLEGLVLVTPNLFQDERGFFLETFNEKLYRDLGIDCSFVQDNHSYSQKGTLRGLHFQSSPGQDKLIRCAQGEIYDVAVDIRPESPTFGKWYGVILDSEKHQQLFIPKGFAHGFCVLSESAHVLYKVSSLYDPKTECGFRWDDPNVAVEWPIENPLVSERDKNAPFFDELNL